MPRSKQPSTEEMTKTLEKYRSMGGGFAAVVKETEEALNDLSTVKATYDELRDTVTRNFVRLETAASVVGGGK